MRDNRVNGGCSPEGGSNDCKKGRSNAGLKTGWVQNDPTTGAHNDTAGPYKHPEQTARYVTEWVKGAKLEHDLQIDYVGCAANNQLLLPRTLGRQVLAFAFLNVFCFDRNNVVCGGAGRTG